MPLQELKVLPDGSLLRPNDSGYDDTRSSRNLKTCTEDCPCGDTNNQTDRQTDAESQGRYILNVTQETSEQGAEEAVQKRSPNSSDGSYCDCNFCLQNGRRETVDPIARFRRESERREPPDAEIALEGSWSTQVTRFRDTWPTSDDSMGSSMSSFTCQDDIVASSPLARDVTRSGDDTARHEDTALMLGSLMLLPAETPCMLGHPAEGITDSLVVVGSNSHVSRLSDSEDEGNSA